MCSKLAVFNLDSIITIWLKDLEALSSALRGFQSISAMTPIDKQLARSINRHTVRTRAPIY